MAYFKENISLGGQFREKEYGNYFEFRPTTDPWAIKHGLEFEIAVGPDYHSLQVRFAKILKTVAYVAVDEDENGNPVYQKWEIKKIWERI